MTTSFEAIKKNTAGLRESFNNDEVEGTKSFINHMRNKGYDYSIHSFIDDEIEKFIEDGFIAINTEKPKVGVLFVKTVKLRGFLGKRKTFLMYIAEQSDMQLLNINYRKYRRFFDAFEDFGGLRDNLRN